MVVISTLHNSLYTFSYELRTVLGLFLSPLAYNNRHLWPRVHPIFYSWRIPDFLRQLPPIQKASSGRIADHKKNWINLSYFFIFGLCLHLNIFKHILNKPIFRAGRFDVRFSLIIYSLRIVSRPSLSIVIKLGTALFFRPSLLAIYKYHTLLL